MPHCEYDDVFVEEMYRRISALMSEATLKIDHSDVCNAVGSYANPTGNARGLWLAQWASEQKLAIANTMFKQMGKEMDSFAAKPEAHD